MIITIGLQVNPYYSVTLCDINVHVLSSHIKRCCYRHAFCLHCIILDCCLNQTQIVLIEPALVNLGLLHPVYKQM